MCRKLIYLTSFVLALSLAGNVANAGLEEGLLVWHEFDDLTDLSGNGHDGVLGGDAYVSGSLLHLDGDGDYMDVGPDTFGAVNPCGGTSDYTIAIAYSCTNTAEGFEAGNCMLVAIGPLSGGENDLSMFTSNNGQYVDIWYVGAVESDQYAQIPYANGDIHWAIMTYTAATDTFAYYGIDDSGNMVSGGSGTLSYEQDYSTYSPRIGVGHEGVEGDIGPSGDGVYVHLEGQVDAFCVYDRILTTDEMAQLPQGLVAKEKAYRPVPADGALHTDTWVTLSWLAGGYAVSHDVYLGDNFDDVNDGTGDTFRGNQELNTTFYIAGFPGYAYPDGLVNGMTYYWRIDEVNEAEPNSPWKGDVWSFLIPPKTAYYPDPADGAEFVDLNVMLTWTAGFNAKIHYIVFGEDFDEVSNAAAGVPSGPASYSPGPLKLAKTYYWRVDEFDSVETHKGEVWSFTTEGAVSSPNPADGAVDVKPSVVLKWVAGAVAESHEVYFDTDADAVANATTTSPEYKGAKALGEESYDPGKLTLNTTYYWRIDEVNGVNPDSPWAGNVWSFTTGDFFVIDNFEIYDANDNQIWYSWHDGLGYGAPGTDPYFAGNGTGAAVGDETTASYTEETIVHGGGQSMPVAYDNNKQGYAYYSEVEHTLTDQRDWTEEGVANLSLWFRGYPASVGSFAEGPVGTYTITGSGADIWGNSDEFHFAYRTLTGIGSMVARVESVDQTDNWAKAGVMIRETLDLGSVHAMTVVTPAQGVSFQRRTTADGSSSNTDATGLVAPYWVKIERDIAGNFSGYSSANGSTWEMLGTWENIQMSSNVYIGLAVTAHNASATCQAVFTNVMTTGTVSPQWTNQDIGILSNDAEPLYVAVSNSAGTPAVVVHDDPAAAQIDTWTEWVIPLQAFVDQGTNLSNVDRIAIGLGTQGNMATPGGSGKMFIDDIRLYRPREAAGE